MSFIGLCILIILVGVALWAVCTYIPMQATVKRILVIVVVIVLVLLVLDQFGVLDAVRGVRVPKV